MFWLWIALVLAAVTCVAAWPLVRRGEAVGSRGGVVPARHDTVRALYQDRLNELDLEQASGQLAPESRAEMEQELAATLLRDFQPDEPKPDPTRAVRRPGLGLVLGVLIPLCSLGVYLSLGEPTADQIRGAEVVLGLDPETQRDQLTAWSQRLAARVEVKPKDAESWYLLGNTQLQLGAYQAAAESFAMAHARFGEDPTIDLYWLQSRYLAAGGMVDASTRAIAERILARDPSNALVLEMYAVDAFRKGEFRQAVGYLNRGLAVAVNPAQRAALGAGMAQARAQLGDLKPSVDVAVATTGSPPQGATLFVIARPIGGGMPYAVVRRPALDLPLTVRLDDAVSMNPANPLSAAPAVEVVVRISRSGSPMAQPGDWEWQSTPLELADIDTPLRLEAVLNAPGTPAAGAD